MDPVDIRKNYAHIRAAANDVLTLFGLMFTNKQKGHVETDISAAASFAGVSILQGKGFDMNDFRGKDGSLSPGTGVRSQIGFVKWACVYCPVLHKTPLGISKGESIFRA